MVKLSKHPSFPFIYNMATRSLLFLLVLILQNSVQCAVFENITVTLTTRWKKFFYYGQPAQVELFIQSSDTFDQYLNFQPLEIAVVRNQNIPVLKQHSVANLPNIVDVHLIADGIRKIEPGTFYNVPRLDTINLGDNLIEEIEDGVFSNLPISSLYLQNNRISKLGAAAFNNMTLLSLINLNNSKLTTWNSDWFLGSPVYNLFLANNLIEELPDDVFQYLYEFKKVNIPLSVWNFVVSNNRIKNISENAFRRVNAFGVISLKNNSLESLPKKVFRTVKNINHLDLNYNSISSVEGLFDDINVNYLHLINNTLSCFPMEVFEVSRLYRVYVHGNKFTCECVSRWVLWQQQLSVNVINYKDLEKMCPQHQ